MSASPGWRRFARALAFARQVPPAQLLRRARLSLRRVWRDATGWRSARTGPAPAMSSTPPAPLFAPRTGMIALDATGPRFCFIGRTHAMAGGVDWRAPSPAPADQLWRMHLHAMEYLEEVDDATFARLIEDWISANAPMRKGAWRDSWNAYALSLRVVVWMQQIAARRERLPESLLPRLLASLAEQIAFLADNLETDIRGNHLIKNIKALIWASAFFAGKEAALWRGMGVRLLKAALAEQILRDGVHYERSPSYHAQVFADLLECRHALAASARPGALDGALRLMARATADLAHPDGGVAQFNDAGLHMAYSPNEGLSVYAAQFGPRPEPRPSFALPAAGYFGRRWGDDYLVVDCGRIGPDALPAHAHGDILSFEWSVAGERIIVDQGVYEYYAGARRAASRSAASHNTLCFDGADQADFFGSFRCGRKPEIALLSLAGDDERLVLEGTHDGYRGFGRHVRRIEATRRRLSIVDRIEAAPGRRASAAFLLHPEVVVSAGGDAVILKRGAASIEMRSSAKILVEPAVWWPDLGYERATSRLRLNWSGGNGEIAVSFDAAATGS